MGNMPPKPLPPLIEIQNKVLNPRQISFDNHGNLRFGGPERDRNEELMQIMATDKDHVSSGEDDEWYIMDSSWVQSWLLYVYLDPDNAPGPGKCRNDRLVTDRETELSKRGSCKLKAQTNLRMATLKRGGDYRRVSKETWLKFQELYPGSGPTIIARFPSIVPANEENCKHHSITETERIGAELGMESDGRYDTSQWIVIEEVVVEQNKNANGNDLLSTITGAAAATNTFFQNLGDQMQKGTQALGEQMQKGLQVPAQLSKKEREALSREHKPIGKHHHQPPSANGAVHPAATTSNSASAVAGGGSNSNSSSSSSSSSAKVSVKAIALASKAKAKAKAKVEPPQRRNQQYYDEFFFNADGEGEGVELSPPHTPASASASGAAADGAAEAAGAAGAGPVDNRLYDAYSKPGGSLFSGEPPAGAQAGKL